MARPERQDPAGDLVIRTECQRELLDAVLGLREPYRSTVLLSFYDNLSAAEIAAHHGTSPGTVRVWRQRALRQLRRILDRRYSGDRRDWQIALLPLAGAPPAATPRRPQLGGAGPGALPSIGGSVAMAAKSKAFLISAALLLLAGGGALAPSLLRRVEVQPRELTSESPAAGVTPPEIPLARRDTVLGRGAQERPEDTSILTGVDRDRDLHGVVVGPAHDPIPDAAITVFRHDGRGVPVLDWEYVNRKAEVAQARTTAAGEYRIRLEPDHRYSAAVFKEGYAQIVLAECSAGERVLIQLARPAALRGRVTDHTGSSIEGAMVLANAMGESIGSAMSDSSGRYELGGLPAGDTAITVRAPSRYRLQPVHVGLRAGDIVEHDFVLPNGVRVRGQVVAADTKLPIEGALVDTEWSFEMPVRTDAEGRFELAGVATSEFMDFLSHELALHVRATGYSRTKVATLIGSSDVDLAIEMVPGGTLRGTVVDERGVAVPGCYIAAHSYWSVLGGIRDLVDARSCRTAPDGGFLLDDLRQDIPHVLVLQKEGYATSVYDLSEGWSDREIDVGVVVIQDASCVTGCVVDERGSPVNGVTMSLQGWNDDRGRYVASGMRAEKVHVRARQARSDDLGRFRFPDVAVGEYALELYRMGYVAEISEMVRVTASGEQVTCTLVMPDGETIAGRVVAPAGKPVPYAHVRVQSDNRLLRRSVTCDPLGNFAFRGLPTGHYDLYADPGRHRIHAGSELLGLTRCSWHEVAAGSTEVELVLARAGTIRGHVLHADGSPASHAQVEAYDQGGMIVTAVRCDAAGAFSVEVAEGEPVDLEFATSRHDSVLLYGASSRLEDAYAGGAPVRVVFRP